MLVEDNKRQKVIIEEKDKEIVALKSEISHLKSERTTRLPLDPIPEHKSAAPSNLTITTLQSAQNILSIVSPHSSDQGQNTPRTASPLSAKSCEFFSPNGIVSPERGRVKIKSHSSSDRSSPNMSQQDVPVTRSPNYVKPKAVRGTSPRQTFGFLKLARKPSPSPSTASGRFSPRKITLALESRKFLLD